MSTQDYLNIQIRLLVTHFGRRPVLEAFSAASEVPPDRILDEIAKLGADKRAKAAKHPKTLGDIINALPAMSEGQREVVENLGRLYEAKQFLPNLRDAYEFFRRSGLPLKKQKSRKEAMAYVITALSSMPQHELEVLLADTTRSAGQSDFALLARQLVGEAR
ncbi:MAG: hypothetical protein ACLQVX_23155 [Limisphaerales bacterium]